MPFIASDANVGSGRYHFQFAWNSPYGHAVRLLQTLRGEGGLVIDVGCGFGPLAEVVVERGFRFVGCELDPEAARDLQDRGFECHQIDLREYALLPERLVAIAAGRKVHALLLLDVLEHLPETQPFLQALRAASLRLDRPALVVSVPNVAHFDLGAKLAVGRWDVCPTGLLDETHVQFFTEIRLAEELRRFGWVQFAAADFRLRHSDQSFPSDHPALTEGSPLRDFLWSLRAQVNDTGTVNQFVRAFALTEACAATPTSDEADVFLSVILRTQGKRDLNLLDALTCLAAQADDRFEVRLLVHSADADVLTRVRGLVERFQPEFSHRVRVHHVLDGGRARPLNVGLAEASGRYVAFLDDDDLVAADWIETFRRGAEAAPGRVIRSIVADRPVRRPDAGELPAPFVALGGLVLSHAAHFDFVEHLLTNRTPFCSFAVPIRAAREMRIAFHEDLFVVEDWDFLMRVAMLAGVHDTKSVTSIYHRWQGAESSLGAIPAVAWNTARRTVLQRFDGAPLLLPSGSASRLSDHLEQEIELVRSLRAEVAALGGRAEELKRLAEALRGEAGAARWEAERIRNSKFWRATGPFRRALDVVRGFGRGGRRQNPTD